MFVVLKVLIMIETVLMQVLFSFSGPEVSKMIKTQNYLLPVPITNSIIH